jgi:biotin transport system ATP-binding protein
VQRTIAALPENVIIISHDLPLVEDFDRVLLFDQGRLVVDAPAAEAIAHYKEMAS